MYKKEIEEYIDSHRQEMLDDICTLCRINSEKMPYVEGKPYGEGPFEMCIRDRGQSTTTGIVGDGGILR